MAVNNIKNRLIAVQRDRIRRLGAKREAILKRIEYMTRKFGDDSVQATEEKEKLLRHDDMNLKERAIKFKEFLDGNNEKVTKAFCKLSKEGGLCDDMTQICGGDGKPFNTDEDRQKHVRKFYEKLYKEKLDRLLQVEDFLTNETLDQDWVRRRRLTEEEKMEIEGEVTLAELTESLDASNFHSSSG
jgi:hypothetical protein